MQRSLRFETRGWNRGQIRHAIDGLGEVQTPDVIGPELRVNGQKYKGSSTFTGSLIWSKAREHQFQLFP